MLPLLPQKGMEMINIYGPINTLGYGIHTTNFAYALKQKGYDVRFRPIGTISNYNSDYLPMAKDLLETRIEDFDAPTIVLWHQQDVARYRGTPLIGYTVFETQKLSEDDVKELSNLTYIFVVSEWAKNVLEQYDELKDKVYVVPEGVEETIYSPNAPTTEASQAIAQAIGDRYCILSIGKYEKRKGTDKILELMEKKIKNGMTQVCLLAMWHNPFIQNFDGGLVQKLADAGFFLDNELSNEMGMPIFDSLSGGHRIIYLPRGFTEVQLASIYHLADLGIFPYCAEGWNLPLLDVLACGTPCIATNYSGPTEYLGDTDCTLIEEFEMVPAEDEMWFDGTLGDWAEVSIDHLYDLVVKHFANGKGIRNECAEKVIENWSWDKAAEKAKAILDEIL